jgi:hypothetical protein
MIQVVDLVTDEDPSPDTVYIRGHLPAEESAMLEAAVEWLADLAEQHGVGEEHTPPRLGVGRQLYARWGIASPDSDWDRGFYICHKSRGAFAVTEVVDLGQRDAQAARKVRQDAREAALTAFVLEWFPEAFEVTAHGYPTDGGQADFRLPGLNGKVSWDAKDPESAWVLPGDQPTWGLLYGDRKRPPVPAPE